MKMYTLRVGTQGLYDSVMKVGYGLVDVGGSIYGMIRHVDRNSLVSRWTDVMCRHVEWHSTPGWCVELLGRVVWCVVHTLPALDTWSCKWVWVCEKMLAEVWYTQEQTGHTWVVSCISLELHHINVICDWVIVSKWVEWVMSSVTRWGL